MLSFVMIIIIMPSVLMIIIIMISVILLNGIMISVIMPTGIMLSAIMLNAVNLSAVMLSVVMLSDVMLSVNMLSDVMLNVVQMRVVAPLESIVICLFVFMSLAPFMCQLYKDTNVMMAWHDFQSILIFSVLPGTHQMHFQKLY